MDPVFFAPLIAQLVATVRLALSAWVAMDFQQDSALNACRINFRTDHRHVLIVQSELMLKLNPAIVSLVQLDAPLAILAFTHSLWPVRVALKAMFC